LGEKDSDNIKNVIEEWMPNHQFFTPKRIDGMLSIFSGLRARLNVVGMFNSMPTRSFSKTHKGAAKRWRKMANGQFKRVSPELPQMIEYLLIKL
jgi:hypothetical protein